MPRASGPSPVGKGGGIANLATRDSQLANQFPGPLEPGATMWGLKTTEMYSLATLEARSSKSRCHPGGLLLEALGGRHVVPSPSGWQILPLGVPRLVDLSLRSLPCPHVDFSVSVCALLHVCPSTPFPVSYTDTVITLRAHPGALILVFD